MVVRRFKRFVDIDLELGRNVVFVGPNNLGKTSALQALFLWQTGVAQWSAKRSDKDSRSLAKIRTGVTINRKDLIFVPVPDANHLWRDLHVRDTRKIDGKKTTQNVRIEIVVEGVDDGAVWTCGMEFDYGTSETIYARPLQDPATESRSSMPEAARRVRIEHLPPMSGLASSEPLIQPGRMRVLMGEGRTAEILRNLCWIVFSAEESRPLWTEIVDNVRRMFGVRLRDPVYDPDRGEIHMTYAPDESKTVLDLSSAGRGLQQTLLLLAHLAANPRSVLLLDEPDAHLEVLRQRQVYQLITETAAKNGSQIIAATHSEVVLNEAAEKDIVVAFVGKPHRIDDRGSQVAKSLKEVGFDQYYQAEQQGWVLYLEGSTDLAILRTFADQLGHPAAAVLQKPFVRYVLNDPREARNHFFALREAKADLVGIAILDRVDPKLLQHHPDLIEIAWKRREIENYFCSEEVLIAYAGGEDAPSGKTIDFIFESAKSRRVDAMRNAIRQIDEAMRTLKNQDPWSIDVKASEEVLEPIFRKYFDALGLPNLLRKSNFHELASLLPPGRIDPEVVEKLDLIVSVASRANTTEE